MKCLSSLTHGARVAGRGIAPGNRFLPFTACREMVLRAARFKKTSPPLQWNRRWIRVFVRQRSEKGIS